MSIANPSFETAGATPGQAASWTVSVVSSAESIAEFGTDALDGAERFESGWDNDAYLFALEDGDIESAVFDELVGPSVVEDFGHGWDGNELFLWELASVQAATFDGPVGEAFEDFEDDWFDGTAYIGLARPFIATALTNMIACVDHGFVNGSVVRASSTGTLPAPLEAGVPYYVRDVVDDTFKLAEAPGGDAIDLTSTGVGTHSIGAEFAAADLEAAVFDVGAPEAAEDFEEEWLGNEAYQTTFDPADISGASFGDNTLTHLYESFEAYKPPQVFTANATTDTMTCAGHGLGTTDWKISFSAVGGRPPTPLQPGTSYFLKNVAPDTFQVAASDGGAAVDLTDAGLGTQYVTPDPLKFWIEALTSV